MQTLQGSKNPVFSKEKPNPVGFWGGFGFYWVFWTSRKK